MQLFEGSHRIVGNDQSLRPQFEIRGNSVYPTIYNKAAGTKISQPWYELRGDHLFQTTFHPEGHSIHPTHQKIGNEFHSLNPHPAATIPSVAFHIRP